MQASWCRNPALLKQTKLWKAMKTGADVVRCKHDKRVELETSEMMY